MDRQLHREIGKHLPRRKRNRERERWSTRACRPPPPRRHSVSALKSSPLLILPPPPTLRSSLYLRSPFVPVPKEKDKNLPNSRIMIHQPLGVAQGGQTDIDIQYVGILPRTGASLFIAVVQVLLSNRSGMTDWSNNPHHSLHQPSHPHRIHPFDACMFDAK
ncbi:hypothetical protein I3843_08G086200 [Carya illinoinensis]|nr:hypothetical protein I3843_08G086200 [Carya illinoinensis]